MNASAARNLRTENRLARLGLLTEPAGYVDGVNLYEFVGSNPINFVDPNGMNKENMSSAGAGQSTFAPPIGNPDDWEWRANPGDSRGGRWHNDKTGQAGNYDFTDSHWDIDDGTGNRQRYDVRGNKLTPGAAHNPPRRRMLPLDPRKLGRAMAGVGAVVGSGMASAASINGFICNKSCKTWFISLFTELRKAHRGEKADATVAINRNYKECYAALPAILGDAGMGAVGVLSSQAAMEKFSRVAHDALVEANAANGY